MTVRIMIKPGSQYDAGAASAMNITGKKTIFSLVNSIPDVKFLTN